MRYYNWSNWPLRFTSTNSSLTICSCGKFGYWHIGFLGQNWQMPFSGKKKKKKQYFAQFSKLIREMPLFWNLILRIYSGVLELELHAFFFLPITRVHGAWVSKCHCRSLKSHYKLLKNATIRLNSILRKLSFKRGVFP